MNASAREAYLETQVLTATPQRLRLLLIDAAIRKATAARVAFQSGNVGEALEATNYCRDILCELIAGIAPDKTPEAKQIMGVYMFLFSTLVEAQITCDPTRLGDILRVLEEERITWQAVCQQMPERPVPVEQAEERAPMRVDSHWTPGYSAVPARASLPTAAAGLSLEA